MYLLLLLDKTIAPVPIFLSIDKFSKLPNKKSSYVFIKNRLIQKAGRRIWIVDTGGCLSCSGRIFH